jgi:hypothetical protein
MIKGYSQDLSQFGYSYSRIVFDHYVRNWKDERGSSKFTIAKRAVQAYLSNDEQQRNVDPTFRQPEHDLDADELAKHWSHQIDKFFSPNETVKLPYSFGDYLVMSLDEPYRKACLIALDKKRRIIIKQVNLAEGDLNANIQSTIKETSEAIQHLVSLASRRPSDNSVDELMRGRQELIEAIDSLQHGLGHIDYELSKRGIELIE